MTAAIIYPVHNALEFVKRSLPQIRETTPLDTPLVMVDDCSDPETCDYLRDELRGMREFRPCALLRNKRQQLFTRSVNLGMRAAYYLSPEIAAPEIMVLVNTDVDLRPCWYECLVKAMEGVPTLAMVGYRDSPPDGLNPESYTTVRYPDYITGHCIALRTKALRQIGVFCETDTDGRKDPALAPYHGQAHIGSERIWCWRAMNAGWEAAYCNAPLCFHAAGQSWKHDLAWLSRFNLEPLWEANDSLNDPHLFGEAVARLPHG